MKYIIKTVNSQLGTEPGPHIWQREGEAGWRIDISEPALPSIEAIIKNRIADLEGTKWTKIVVDPSAIEAYSGEDLRLCGYTNGSTELHGDVEDRILIIRTTLVYLTEGAVDMSEDDVRALSANGQKIAQSLPQFIVELIDGSWEVRTSITS